MTPFASADHAAWSAALRAIIRETRKSARIVVTERVRAALGYVMQFTPPKNRAQGRAAVKRDLISTMRPIRTDGFDNENLKRIVRRGDRDAFNAFTRHLKHGPLKGMEAVAFSPDVHERARDRRGRVRRNYRQVVIGASDSARWKKYLSQLWARVGWARSGWLPALRAVSGKAPGWVLQHGNGQKAGGVIDGRAHPTNPEVTVINNTAWAANGEGRRVVENALTIHGKIMRRDIKRIVKQNAARQKVPLVRWE